MPILLLATALSGSRGGVAALAAVALLFLVPAARGRLRPRQLIGLALGLAAGGCVAWRLAEKQTVTNRYGLETIEEGGFSHRPQLLERALEIFVQHPLVGAGMDGYYANGGWTIGMGYPHNIIAQLAVDVGVAGLFAAFAACWFWRRETRPWSRLPAERLGCAAVAVYIAIASMFSGDLYDGRMAFIFAVFAANHATQARGNFGRR
jgi:O-antigen ligase